MVRPFPHGAGRLKPSGTISGRTTAIRRYFQISGRNARADRGAVSDPATSAPEIPAEIPARGKALRDRRQRPEDLPAAAPPVERLLLIIGAMKSGTSSLYRYLAQHPQVARHWIKEPNFFSDDDIFDQGRDYYLRGWPDFDPARHRYAMEASTRYTKAPRCPDVPRRIAGLGAAAGIECRLLYIVRDPVARIESQIAHNLAHDRPAGLGAGHGRGGAFDPDAPPLRHALDVSRYAYQLDRFRACHPASHLLVLDFERLCREPLAVTAQCVDFLGLDPGFAFRPRRPANARKRVNGSDSFRLDPGQRARLREILRPDAERFAAGYGFDIGRWGFR